LRSDDFAALIPISFFSAAASLSRSHSFFSAESSEAGAERGR
jgi:hypothetical protein